MATNVYVLTYGPSGEESLNEYLSQSGMTVCSTLEIAKQKAEDIADYMSETERQYSLKWTDSATSSDAETDDYFFTITRMEVDA